MKLAPQHRIYIGFFIFASTMGALLSRMPDLQSDLGVDKSELGLTLIGQAIGALIALTFCSRLVGWLGTRITAFITLIGIPVAVAIIPWLGSASLVFIVLALEGLLAGALEINLNVEGDRIEAQQGKGVLNTAHGFWSLGFFTTALISSAVRQAGVSIQTHMLVVLAIALAIGIPTIWGMQNTPARSLSEDTRTPIVALPTFGLIPLCVIGIAAFLIEGAGIDWSAIYMRDVFSVEPFIGGLGLTLFTGFMTVVRLGADPLVDRFGARAVAVLLLMISGVGTLLVWIAPHPYVALAGFALMGAGCSAVYPLAISAAAQRSDRPAHLNVAAVSQMSFVIFFFGPPILGFVAQHAGIATSYLICVPIILCALLSARSLPTRRPIGSPKV